ncbi:MAG: glycan-binding surface protein, partial [Bacteroidota bacterium]
GDQKDIGGTNGVLHLVDGLLTPPTVADHLKANPDYSMLAAAVERAQLTGALDGAGTFTVFAPTNLAFEKFLMDVNSVFGWSGLEEIPLETLQEVLSYHVISGANVTSADVDGLNPTTIGGGSFSIAGASIDDASPANATIGMVDVQAVNGIVHGIDKVLLTDNVYQAILSASLNLPERLENRGFTDFLAAVNKAGLSTSLQTADVTVFAPNNDAFIALFATIDNFSSLDDFDTDEDIEVLKQLLEYHMVNGQLLASQLMDGGTLTSVKGDDITVDLSGDDPRLIPTLEDVIPTKIVTTNIGSTNAVIHEVDRLLIPEDLARALGIETGGGVGLQPVTRPELVFFDWDGKDHWWGNAQIENDASVTLDGSNYGRVNFQTGGTGWNDLFWRNSGTMNGADEIGSNVAEYSLKFDINVLEPIDAGRFRIRFNNSNSGVDSFYDWAPWEDTGEAFSTDGWITVEIPLALMPQTDYTGLDQEFGMAFEGADLLLDFAIDNVRFDSPGSSGPDPVDDPNLVFFDWDGKDHWWGNATVENDAAITLDGSNYGRLNFQTGGTGWNDLFWRNSGTMNGADIVGTNVSGYSLKFDINVLEPINDGMFRIRFNNSNSGVDSFYDWAPWKDTGEAFSTDGWVTVEIPLALMPQTDYTGLDQEFGMAFEGADILLNLAIDNVRFEAN